MLDITNRKTEILPIFAKEEITLLPPDATAHL
jgi:hypothetical protein